MGSILRAIRVLRRDRIFTVVAIGSLALGIGATSAMFSFADAMLLRPLPVRDADRVVTINTSVAAPYGENPPISYPDYRDVRDHNRSFDGVVAFSYSSFGFSPDARTQPRMRMGLYVSADFFQVLGVQPELGRSFRDDETQIGDHNPVLVLGHDFWVNEFGASPSAIGSRARLNGVEFTVIGVAPERFTGVDTILRPQVFVPLAMSPQAAARFHDRDAGWLCLKGRLKPGVTLEMAQSDVAAISSQLEKMHRVLNRERRLRVQTELQLRRTQIPVQSAMLAMLTLLGVCVLVVACANVTGLLLSRARARSREIAVRLAIGAGRAALIRQLLLENLLVALAGGLAGLWVAGAIAEYLRSFPVPGDLPIVFDVAVDARALLVTLVVSVLSTLLFGLTPAMQATRLDLVPALKSLDPDSANRRRLWGRNTIVAGQVAVSVVLLSVCAALVQGFRHQLLPGPGYRVDRLFLTSFDTQLARYPADRTSRFYADLLTHIRTSPGIRSAALASSVPMQASPHHIGVAPEGLQLAGGERSIDTLGAYVSDGYFETMDIPILRGREFRESDNLNAPLVAVVNERMAQRVWGGTALGKRFRLDKEDGPLVEVVGIARMAKYTWIAEAPTDFVYLACRQHPRSAMTLLTESSGPDAAAAAPAVRDVIRKLDPDMPAFLARTMRDLYRDMGVKASNLIVDLVGGMGVMALILAAVGLYGLVAYSVSRRTREIGIRMALGADREAVARMVLWQGMRLGIIGAATGLIFAHFACRAVTAAFDLTNIDPLMFAGAAFPLLVVTALAAWSPAVRAAQVDPLLSVRHE